jgi:hypothetical protein
LQLNLREVHPSKWKPTHTGTVIADHIKLRRYEILLIYIGEKTMKNIFILLCGALFTLTSCGISSRYSSTCNEQRFSDAIYSYTPAKRDRQAEQRSKTELQDLSKKTQASQIYLYGDFKDTVVIPENMAATIKYDKLNGTSITIADFDPYDFTYGWYADRYRWNNLYWNYGGYYSWHYSRWHHPWHYSSFYSPWYHGGWYDPWYYDPWYYGGFYGGFYDPWYYGWAGWYDPYYHYMHPHYCGWYGGWGPSHHHHHVSYPSGGKYHGRDVYRGSRLETSGRGVIAGTSGSSSSNGNSIRRVSTTSRNSFGTSRTASTRQVQGRSSATYRRPAGSTSSRSSISSSNSSTTYTRSSSSQSSRSYTTPSSSRSSYSSGSSGSGYSRSSSSSSGGGYSRSSSGGGGGYSRSSSGTRR